MKRSVLLVNPFDAFAGSQRMLTIVHQAFQGYGINCRLTQGFGSKGFVSNIFGSKTFLHINNIRLRKFLYPFWVLWENFITLRAVLAHDIVWINTIYGAPSVLLAALFHPRQLVIHIHEIECPSIFVAVTRFLQYKGATLVCVSSFQQRLMQLNAVIIPNCAQTDECVHTQRNRFIFVGTTSPAKGFALYLEVARRLKDSGIEPWAFFPNKLNSDPDLVTAALGAGVTICYGITKPADLFINGFISFVATDPVRVTETFSLVCAESISCMVPVGGAGTKVLREVAGTALAFDEPDRDPDRIACTVLSLWHNRSLYEDLVAACKYQRLQFSKEVFIHRINETFKKIVYGL